MSSPPHRPKPAVANGRVRTIVRGSAWTRWLDVYHELLRRPWSFTLTLLFVSWLATNGIFALLYLVGGDCIAAPDPDSFFQAFSFSVQTISSIGYGAMHPTTDWARLLANAEAFIGMVMVAMGTGLMFAKFSRPTARIDFSEQGLIHLRDGIPHLVFRVANRRGNRIVGAKMTLAVLIDEQTSEGHSLRRLHDLRLHREHTPTFALSMTLTHRLDSGVLAGLSREALRARIVTLILTIQGLDETFNQTVQAQYSYGPQHLLWDHRFADMVDIQPDGSITIDPDLLSEVRPMPVGARILRAD